MRCGDGDGRWNNGKEDEWSQSFYQSAEGGGIREGMIPPEGIDSIDHKSQREKVVVVVVNDDKEDVASSSFHRTTARKIEQLF